MAAEDLFDWPWVPANDSSYPDRIVTCKRCGATVADQSGSSADFKEIHEAFHASLDDLWARVTTDERMQ